MADLNAIDTKKKSDSGAWMTIKDLKGEDLVNDNGEKMQLLIAGKDSTKYRKVLFARVNENSKKKTEQSIEQVEESSLSMLCELVLDIRGVVKDGEPVAYSHDSVRDLLANYPVIREQVDAFIVDRSNFLLDA